MFDPPRIGLKTLGKDQGKKQYQEEMNNTMKKTSTKRGLSQTQENGGSSIHQ
jgi:hypothetical protein